MDNAGDLTSFTASLARQPAVLVTVEATQGSVPREVGAWMAVFARDVVGTIGGGHVEFTAIEEARRRLRGDLGDPGEPVRRYALGPSLGQCCGGVVHLRFEAVAAADAVGLQHRLAPPMSPVALFGGGHVGRAIVAALAPLPFELTWIDSRDEIFPGETPVNVHCEHSDPVQAAVAELPAGASVLVMSFSHAEDLDVVAACLARQRQRADLAFIGLIGSKSKWQTFRHRLADRGFTESELAQVTCPIGLAGIAGKEPAVIAASVAAQLLQRRHVAAT